MSTPAGKQPQAAPAVPQHTDLQGSASLTGGHVHARPPATGRYLALLSLGALGVVYGDIGTSPLYALRESFHGAHAVRPTPANIYGVLSLVFWALILVDHDQICHVHPARRQPRRRRYSGADLTGNADPAADRQPGALAGQVGCIRRRPAVRRRHHHARHLGVERGGRLNRRDAPVSTVCRAR